ncbi:MAG: DUF485 domain-containing protein [Aeoliella sp.]
MPQRNARLGLWFFGLYVLLYGSFVLVNAFWPDAMERTPWLGVNLAIWSGFGLIIVAILMSLVYGVLCRSGNDANGEESRQ